MVVDGLVRVVYWKNYCFRMVYFRIIDGFSFCKGAAI